jgi:magnesium-transporting ATPase (P-type)
MKPAYQDSAESVTQSLGTDPHRGLSSQEAESRLRREGLNELTPEGGSRMEEVFRAI